MANWRIPLVPLFCLQLGLLDFGATREFRPFFVDNYFKIIEGSANDDRDAVLDYSKKVGFLTGYESQVLRVHVVQEYSLSNEYTL